MEMSDGLVIAAMALLAGVIVALIWLLGRVLPLLHESVKGTFLESLLAPASDVIKPVALNATSQVLSALRQRVEATANHVDDELLDGLIDLLEKRGWVQRTDPKEPTLPRKMDA